MTGKDSCGAKIKGCKNRKVYMSNPPTIHSKELMKQQLHPISIHRCAPMESHLFVKCCIPCFYPEYVQLQLSQPQFAALYKGLAYT